MDPKGRVAVITGASSGIGLAVAEHLAAAGTAVVLGARREDRLRAAAERIREAGGRAEGVLADVTREDDVARLVRTARETFGGLDIMVCNAGFGYYGRIEETGADVMQRMMDVNFMGTFFGARAAIPVFRDQGRGHLIVVSSIVGRRGVANMGGYAATKAAQVGLAESLRAEFHGTDIHVSIILPVSTESEFRTAMQRDYGQHVRGTGPRQGAEAVAQAIVACVRRPAAEVYPFRPARVLAVASVIAPRLTDRLVHRYRRETRQ
jgi:NADP-dependent 3-hydroxy acid dehydrogenase YdfG